MSVSACPACLSTNLSMYPLTTRTQRQYFKCRDCKIAGWADRDKAAPEPVGLDVISVEQRTQWIALKRAGLTDRSWVEVLNKVEAKIGGAAGHAIYDIGAGDGHFLSFARKRGFDVGGNDLMQAAVEIAKSEYDISLDLGDIATIDVPKKYDAVTLWCVLAHVPEPDNLLRGSFDLLRPGGVLYLQTPHECYMDRVALGTLTASKGRVSKIVDRRIAGHHWFLHTKKSMTTALQRLGFVDIQVEPRGRYPLQTSAYLQSLGVKGKAGDVAGRAIDQMIDKGAAPRIVLDVYARKPVAF
jgi:2-polyprenyl-3-methyl-5-hydroxy-6-metoxy-1,4-benzoquinol methylase